MNAQHAVDRLGRTADTIRRNYMALQSAIADTREGWQFALDSGGADDRRASELLTSIRPAIQQLVAILRDADLDIARLTRPTPPPMPVKRSWLR